MPVSLETLQFPDALSAVRMPSTVPMTSKGSTREVMFAVNSPSQNTGTSTRLALGEHGGA